jgi:nucleotidyltransferase AbiEii toxin of type IV toxin-antitoxin system
MDFSAKVLGEFERAFLVRLFDSVSAIYLSGGSALGLHLGHRRSLDLDLFTSNGAAFAAARASLPVIAAALDARVEILADGPAFRRVLLSGPAGQTLRVDLVHDTAERSGGPPVESQGLRLDPLREILTNKICAILGRSEPRDLVDLFFLDRAGFRVVNALDDARRKDAGLTPAQLAWAISQVPLDRLPDGLLVPVSLEELRDFRARLVETLERLSFPG